MTSPFSEKDVMIENSALSRACNDALLSLGVFELYCPMLVSHTLLNVK